MKITPKQLIAIKLIEEYTGHPFLGNTKEDAIRYIMSYLKKAN